MKKIIFLSLLLLALLLCMAGCENEEYHPTLTYVVDGEVYHEDVLEKNEIFGGIGKTPTKEGYYFGGWYYDDGTWQKPLNYTELNKKLTDTTAVRVYAKWEVVELEYDQENRSYTVTGLLAGAGNDVVIPATCGDLPITKIASYAFRGNASLTSVVIPDTVTEIGDYAFAECTALTELILPHTVKEVGRNAFSNCVGLERLRLSVALTDLPAEVLLGCARLTSIEIPVSVNSIGARAFAGCTALAEITLPAALKTIGAEAFRGTTMTEIGYKSSAENWEKVSRTDFAKDSAIVGVRCIGGVITEP